MSILFLRRKPQTPAEKLQKLAAARNSRQKAASNETNPRTNVSGAPDEELISAARRGDHDAFGRLVERYYRAAYASAYAVLGNRSDAEEIAQETFVQVFQKLDRLRVPGALTSWIWRIARDSALKHIRKHKRIKPVGQAPDLVLDDAAPHAPMVAAEEKQELMVALEQLPDDMREAVLMRYWEELEYEEMARRTGISAAALYQRVCRGLKHLRESLSGPPPHLSSEASAKAEGSGK
jgi:RNA polymerase sigma-70 factor, ECF subfamily